MSLITGGRVQRFLQKYLGVKGEVVTPELGPELHPVIPVTHLPMELRALDSWASFFSRAAVTGDATHPGQLGFFNPPGSGVVCTIERAWFAYTPAALAPAIDVRFIAANSLAGWTLFNHVPRDIRQTPTFGTGGPVVASIANATPVGTTIGALVAAIERSTTVSIHHWVLCPAEEWVVLPNSLFVFCTNGNTETLDGTFYWRQRALEPSEATA